MNKKWLKKLVDKLNRSDGIAIMAIVALMLMMTVMGGVFSTIMGEWKVSSPVAINTNRATQLANSAATFALQEAKNDITSLNFGGHTTPVIVFNDGNGGTAEYWIEQPGVDDDDTIHPNDDEVDDDGDDGNPNLHTIIATGRVVNGGGTTLAQRQIKVFVDFVP